MEFIQELEEAKLTRNKTTTARLSYEDICEKFYLSMLIVEFLRQFPDTRNAMIEYAKNTESYTSFNRFKVGGTDLHNFIYYIMGDDHALSNLNDLSKAKAAQEDRSFPAMAVSRYIKQLSSGSEPSRIYQLFTDIESGLKIKNSQYKSIRRVIVDRKSKNHGVLKTAAHRLLYAARTHLKLSDLIETLETVVVKNNLKPQAKPDKHTELSKIDSLSDNNLYYIAELVGYSNVFLAIKYLELMEKGETAPSTVQKAFKPAIELLVDIIRGGPSYITALRSLQRQAKQQKHR